MRSKPYLLRKMVADLDFLVDLEVVPTVREPDGLARSSRNRYLHSTRRAEAATLYQALCTTLRALEDGARKAEALAAGAAMLSPNAATRLPRDRRCANVRADRRASPAGVRHRRGALWNDALDRQLVGAAMTRILLGVSGGIAAYKAAALTSTLVQRTGGGDVDVVMTAEAERFITPLTFASLTARPVYTSLWDLPERIPHIRLVREAQVVLVVPATANLIAKLATGVADDLLTAALLAARIPRILAPAMNEAMYEDPVTQANLAALRARGYEIVEPERGFLAERERGVGRLASEERILQALDRALARRQSLHGKRVAITAGPTREPFDPVRFLSNASTGATGIELAREAALRGADRDAAARPNAARTAGRR